MAQFEVTVVDTTGRGAGFEAALYANALAAANTWNGVLIGQGTISVRVNIVELSTDGANGHSPTYVVKNVVGGVSITEEGAASELRTGNDPNGAAADIEINVDPDYVFNHLWFDPNPAASSGAVPADRLDGFSMLLHEMAHALAFNGWRDWATGVLPPPGDIMSVYDQYVVLSGGHRYFVGPNAQAVYGGPVMLNDGNYHHYGNTSGPLSADLTNGLMNGVVFVAGRRSEISELDLAILKDSGLQVMTDRDDTLVGFASNDTIHGRGGNDDIDGAAGNDDLWGDIGGDRLKGGDGDDALYGGAGNDTLTAGANWDVLHGGDGDDWLEGETGNVAFAGVAGTDIIYGDAGNDTVLGGDEGDFIDGGSGTDILVGEGGGDIIYGGSEWDAIDGRAGTDLLYGEGGADIIFGDVDSDTIYGGEGDDIIMGERGYASMVGDADQISGEGGNDLLDGSAGDDVIYGGTGNDVIDGDHGNDLIVGGLGAETIAGSDYNGVTGHDTFFYFALSEGGDSIYGFRTTPGDNDRIDLRYLFDSVGYAGTNPRGDGYLLAQESGGSTYVYADGNGPAGGANWTHLVTLVGTTLSTGGQAVDDYFIYQ